MPFVYNITCRYCLTVFGIFQFKINHIYPVYWPTATYKLVHFSDIFLFKGIFMIPQTETLSFRMTGMYVLSVFIHTIHARFKNL